MPCVMLTCQQYEDLCERRSLTKPNRVLIPRRRRLSNVSSVHDLHMAVVANQLPMVTQILGSFEGDINGKVKGATALGISLFKQRQEIFMELLKFHKATGLIDLDLPSRDHLGRDEPPVVTAARLRFFTGVNMLIEAGADIDGVDIFGHTALWFAIHHRFISASEQLILQGANVSKTDMYNFTPLYLTLNLQLEKSLIHLLLYSGSNVDSPNLHASLSANKSLLSLAVKYGSEDLTMLLLELGVGHQRHGLSIAQKLSRAGITSPKDEFSKTVWTTCANPLSLQEICRATIRENLSWTQNNVQLFTCSILELPLPNYVKRYLLLPQLHDNLKGLLKHKDINCL